MIPVFFGATLLVYALVFLLPGDPIAALSGQRQLPPGVEAQLRHQYHLDQSFIVQYLIYLKGILTGNFGTSYSGRPVSEVMAQAFPVTIRLALLALLFEAVFGIGAGLIAGLRRGGVFDATLLVASLFVIAVPIFVIGFVCRSSSVSSSAGSTRPWGRRQPGASWSFPPSFWARSRSPTCYA